MCRVTPPGYVHEYGRYQSDAHCVLILPAVDSRQTGIAAHVHGRCQTTANVLITSSSGPESLDSDPTTPAATEPASAARHASTARQRREDAGRGT